MPLAATVEVSVNAEVTTTNSDGITLDRYRTGSSSSATGLLPRMRTTLTNGTSANQASKHYHRKHTITASGSVTLDLNALTDERGQTIDFANIKTVLIRVRTPAASKKVVVGNATTSPWAPWLSSSTATEDVHSILYRESPVDGWTVGATANLKIANNTGSSIDVDVSLMGH